MKKIMTLGILALLIVSVVASAAFASPFFDGRGRDNLSEEELDEIEAKREEGRNERQAEMTAFCESGEIPTNMNEDKAEWLEENTEAACKIHEAKIAGASREEIKDLADELGIEKPPRPQRRGFGQRHLKTMQTKGSL